MRLVAHAVSEGHEWVSGPDTANGVKLSMACVIIKAYADECGPDYNLKPCEGPCAQEELALPLASS